MESNCASRGCAMRRERLIRTLINFQARLLQSLPPRAQVAIGAARHLPTYLQWLVHPEGKRRLVSLVGALQGSYAGCRCIVIGNGPSLRRMDLTRLRTEYTFGMNRISLLANEVGFTPSFFAAINRYVLGQFVEEIRQVAGLKFLNWSYRGSYLDLPDTVFVETNLSLSPSGNIRAGYYAGAGTVTVFALQVAFFLGFSEVILIGVDHKYDTKGTPNQAVVAEAADTSHFSRDYFGPGVVWQLPDLPAMERGYRQMRALFERQGRQILDATDGGNLRVFPKVDFATQLESSRFLGKDREEAA